MSRATSVASVLNPETGRFYLQFHCVFGDWFTTVSYIRNESFPSNWDELVEDISEEFFK